MKKLYVAALAVMFIPLFALMFMVGGIGLLANQSHQAQTECVVSGPVGTVSKSVPKELASVATKAGQYAGVDPMAVVLVYYAENYQGEGAWRVPAPPYGKGPPWPVSSAGASGPFQFMPGTWTAYRYDNPTHHAGNVLDLQDAAYGAAAYLRALGGTAQMVFGNADQPFSQPHTIAYIMASYNGSFPGFVAFETIAYVHRAAREYMRLTTAKSVAASSVSSSSASSLASSVTASPVSDDCPGAPTGPVPKGSAEKIAKQILANPNIILVGYVGVHQDVVDASEGKPGTAGAMTSVYVLQLIEALGEHHQVLITAIQSDGRLHCHNEPVSVCPNDPHYRGIAVDIGALDGVVMTGRNAPSLEVISIAEKTLASGQFGQSQCGPDPSFPLGWTDFPDSCDHLHVTALK